MGCYDVVIADVYKPDMNGFELLKIFCQEMHLPVIMMSANCDVNVAMRGLENEARYHLMKPVSVGEVKNIWQPIIRKSKEDTNDIEEIGSFGEIRQMGSSSEENDNPDAGAGWGSSVDHVELERHKRKKGALGVRIDSKGKNVNTAERKARICWDAVLHNNFVKSIDQIGIDSTAQKKIVQPIDASGLSLKNVASHLQKHRLLLGRLNEPKNYVPFRSPPSKSRLKMHPLPPKVGGPGPTSIPNFPSPYNPMGVQPTAANDMQNINASMPATLDSQSFDPIATTRFGQLNHPTNAQPLLQPGSCSSAPSLLQQNKDSMASGMFQQKMEMDSSSTSDTTLTIHWPRQPTPEFLESASLGKFEMQNAQNSDCITRMDNVELIKKFNEFSLSGLQVTSTGDFNRMTQTRLLDEGLSNINSGSNLMNSINNKEQKPLDAKAKGKMPLVTEEEEDIFLPELTSTDFNMDHYMNLDSSNQYPTDYPNVMQGEDVLMGDNSSSYDMDTLSEQVKNPTFWSSSEDQPFGSSTNDMGFKKAPDGTKHKERDFDLNLFPVDKDEDQ
ncbi:hypothetical protein MRB53_024469 [Persea americana]|uniref:Uncharacterized protein n=1 Tax=Persea americana TaxID=3435 RepID=A0ACC2LD64_PERAE|nr:hypothetical protein MRB53_024469 [Persea americana]